MADQPPPPPYERRPHSRLNLYCLQYVFCAIIVWIVLANIIVYYLLPNDIPAFGKTTQSAQDEPPASEIQFTTVQDTLGHFLSSFSGFAPVLIQPDVLGSLDSFRWDSFSQRRQRVLTFALVGVPNLPEDLEQLAAAIPARVFSLDGRHALLTSPALTLHVVALSREGGLLLTRTPLNSTHAATALKALGVEPGSPLLFLNDAGAFPVESLEPARTLVDGLPIQLPQHIPRALSALRDSRLVSCAGLSPPAEEATRFRRQVRHILTKCVEAFRGLGMRFWLSSGTFLGWYRECGVIPYAGDVDVGVFAADLDDVEDLINHMEHQGFQLKLRLGRVSDSLQLAFFLDDVKLDVYFFYPDPEDPQSVYNAATKPETGEYYWYFFPRFGLCWAAESERTQNEFRALPLRVPCPPIPYLEANYGSGWSRAEESWDWRASPPNVIHKGTWTPEEMTETVQVFEHHSPNLINREL